jgi:hypothetical protein
MTPFDGGDSLRGMATAKLPLGATIEPRPVVSAELLREADELQRIADTLSARAGVLHCPGLGVEHVAEIRELLAKLREVFEERPWREQLLAYCRIEGDEVRADRGAGHDLRGRAERVLQAAGAPPAKGPTDASKRLERVERLIAAYAKNAGGRGKTSSGLVSGAIADLFGVSADSIRKAAARRKR